ncbi:hypothetical protein G9A89_000645 [Geosiphon pyriformis]|nr:hypothetical protein G9A89_000645 [Geosiphon pyriformis]
MRDLTSKYICTVCNPDFDKAFVIFVQETESHGIILTGDVIRAADIKFYDQLDIPENDFKDHVELHLLHFYGEYHQPMLSILKISLATIPRYGTKQSKVRLTLAFTTNGDGTECLLPLIHAMTGDIFRQWLVDWDYQLHKKNQNILLLHIFSLCRHFFYHALDFFDDGADDIYAINQLQAILVNLSEVNNTITLEHLNDDEIANYIITNRKTKHDSSNKKQEVQKIMTIKDALTAITNLEQFMELKNSKEFYDAVNNKENNFQEMFDKKLWIAVINDIEKQFAANYTFEDCKLLLRKWQQQMDNTILIEFFESIKFDPSLQGRKPDFTIFTSTMNKKEFLFMINNGIESKEAIVCGLLVQDLQYDGVYRMIFLGQFLLPRNNYDFGVLPNVIQVLMKAKQDPIDGQEEDKLPKHHHVN